jgi:signal transduction histidine kinase/DNA-binding response OmpR family regulator
MTHILDNIHVGIFELNNKFECIYYNKYIKSCDLSFKNISKECLLTGCDKYVYIDDIEENKICNDNFLNHKKESENICRILHKDSNYHWYKIKRIYDDKNDTFIFTFEDIDEIKKMEIELRQAKQKAERAYNHKALFLANMSHEIRTPLNGIIGMLTLLEDTVLNNDQKNYLEMLRECSINLMTIINDILDYSKLEAGKIVLDIKSFDIRNCIESTNDILISKLYERGIEYNYNINQNMPFHIYGDINRIKQVLLNLLSNSIKFTDKGNITLDISPLELPPSDNDDFIVKFSITDTGCGIALSERDKLFKSFSQIENQSDNKIQQGTGLGLAISKELVTLMGGNIWIDWSEVKKGSRFCFTIKTKKSIEFKNAFEESTDKYILKNKSVFILDDKLENRLGLAAMAQRWGMKVHTYSDAKEALFLLKNIDYDLGFVDICMPDMNGKDFANRLKQQMVSLNKELIPLIALSSLGEQSPINDHNQLFKAHHIKPVKETKLKKSCTDILLLTKYKYKKTPDNNNISLNNYLSNNDLNSGIKDSVRILLVEDIPINQRVVDSFLKKMGFRNIDIAENGKECLEMMMTKKYDIVLLDIRMPIINGENVIKYILDYYNYPDKHHTYKLINVRKPYIIAVTAYCLKEDRQKYLDMGFDDYIPKPISINELNSCMNIFIEKLLQN